MPYSTLIGLTFLEPIVPPPLDLAAFSATMLTSLSNENVKIVSPLNGIGEAPESLAREDLPLTRLIISSTRTGGKREPLDKVVPMF